jgi:cyclophilin family peptidyl-prolyl cis-trans isomerase/HEAT repeat protein
VGLSVSLLSKAGVLAAALPLLVGAGTATVPPLQQIVALERERSLGDHGELAAFLNDPDEPIAVRAALAIGRSKKAGGASLLIRHIHDKRTGVRAMAVYGLGLLNSPVDGVGFLAQTDPSGAVRVAAVDALQRWEVSGTLRGTAEKRAFDALAKALADDADPIVRGRGAIALMAFADGPVGATAAKTLTAAVGRERDDYVRRRVMWTIFRKYASRVPEALLASALRDKDEVVRIEAVRAYGKLKGREFIAALQPLTDDPSWRVQEQARESIRLLSGEKQTEHLTAIPPGTHVPFPERDPFVKIGALPRTASATMLSAPNASQAIYDPVIDPRSAADMTQPAKGPHPRVRIVTTKGNLYLTLYPEWAPLTVANFLNLANSGFYDNNPWFRIVPDFVVQTGEKDAKKAPGPGFSIGAEENPLEQDSYIISMGLNYDDKTLKPIRDSAGSEYYITLSPQFHLDLDFSVFGAVTSGFDVLGRLIESDNVIRVERLPDVTI